MDPNRPRFRLTVPHDGSHSGADKDCQELLRPGGFNESLLPAAWSLIGILEHKVSELTNGSACSTSVKWPEGPVLKVGGKRTFISL